MFNKNKKKIDSRIRFQNSRFTRKLENARGYKRTARILPKNSREIFLSKIGLRSWQSKVATVLVLFLLVYIVYIPNFLFIKNITINGGDTPTRINIKAVTESYLEKKIPWPQKNLILLSDSGLKKYLLGNDQKILSVDKINRHFPNGLSINITPRVDSVLLQTASSTNFTISNDGLVTSEFVPTASTSSPSLPILIKLSSGENLIVGQQAISKQDLEFITKLQTQLPGIVESSLDYYEKSTLNNTEIIIYAKAGFKILFDLNSDLDKNLNRLRLLFSQFPNAEQKKLYYLDMRFDGKGYVCEKGSACVKNINLPKESTTTPNSAN